MDCPSLDRRIDLALRQSKNLDSALSLGYYCLNGVQPHEMYNLRTGAGMHIFLSLYISCDYDSKIYIK